MTVTERAPTGTKPPQIVEMSWDPITRIIGNLGIYTKIDFAKDYNSPKCQVKVGCWGPVVNCNVPKRGWMGGVGGCPNVGGVCIGCTMPGFPDKFMPFMDEPPGGSMSSAIMNVYGPFIRTMRGITNHAANKEPKWRHNRGELTTGYDPRWTGQPGTLMIGSPPADRKSQPR